MSTAASIPIKNDSSVKVVGRMRTLIHSGSFVFAVIFLLHSALLLAVGPASPGSDARWYIEAARILVQQGFNFSAYSQEIPSAISPLFYSGFVFVVAICQSVLGVHWLQGVLLLNMAAVAWSGLLLVQLVSRLTHSATAAWTSLLLYSTSLDILMFERFVLTDTTFMALAFALFSCIARAFLDEPERVRQPCIFAAILLLLLPFWRPTGFILFLPTVMAFLLWLWYRKTPHHKRPLLPQVLCMLAILALIMSVAYSFVLQNSLRWPWPGVAQALRLPYYAKLYHGGVIIFDRPDTFVPPPQTIADYLAISARRLFYFFAFCAPSGFSCKHNLLASLFFVPVYSLALIGIYNYSSWRTELNNSAEAVVIVSCLFVAIFALFHAHTEIDFDWRYRLPILPHLVLLAAVGAAQCQRYIGGRMSRHQPQSPT